MNKYGLSFDQVSVNFIYSFFVDIDNTLKNNGVTDRSIDSLAKILSSTKDNSSPLCSFEGVNGQKKSRNGVPPNLRVRSHEFFHSFSFENVKIFLGNQTLFPDNDQINLSLQGLIRIFDSGISTLTLTMDLKCIEQRPIKTVDIYKLYDLVNMRDDKDYIYPKIVFNSKDYFFIEKTTSNSLNKRLIDVFRDILIFLQTAKKISYHDITVNDTNKQSIIDNSYDNLDCQNPYIVLTCKKTCNTLNSKDNPKLSYLKYPLNWWNYSNSNSIKNFESEDQTKIKQKFRETVLLLFRYIKGATMLATEFDQDNFDKVIPLPYSNSSIEKHFTNFSWFEHIYVASHSRSTIIFYENIENHGSEKAINEIPIFVCESVIDLFEIVRSRWHFSVILNELLDKNINHLNHASNEKEDNFSFSLFNNRKLYASFLSDPLTYSFEGGLVYDLMESAKKSFQLDYLKNSVETKLNVIDRLITDFLRLSYIKK